MTNAYGSLPVLLHLRRVFTAYAAPGSPPHKAGIAFGTVYDLARGTSGAVVAFIYTYDAVDDVSGGPIGALGTAYNDSGGGSQGHALADGSEWLVVRATLVVCAPAYAGNDPVNASDPSGQYVIGSQSGGCASEDVCPTQTPGGLEYTNTPQTVCQSWFGGAAGPVESVICPAQPRPSVGQDLGALGTVVQGISLLAAPEALLARLGVAAGEVAFDTGEAAVGGAADGASTEAGELLPAAEEVEPVGGNPIYRGVPRLTGSGEPNPAFEDALQGNAYPRNPDGLTSAEAHNLGGPEDLADSPFTSWTHRLDVAQLYAGDDGAILQWQTGAPPPGAAWKFEWSPDVWQEQEVLIRGPIEGAQVLP
jgi:hypothetical protein